MTQREEKAEKIFEQEAPSVDDVLDEMMRSGVEELDRMLQDPETAPRLKIAIVKATAFLQRYRAQATGKGVDTDAWRAEIRAAVAQELTRIEMQKKAEADIARWSEALDAEEAEAELQEELDAAAEAESENNEQPEGEAD